jgi:bifunctional ADP-heptose synthase (sugar kinase/adenylyltransferase)
MKGNFRPYNNLADRMQFISSVKFVDSVISFNSDSELIEEIKKYQPDIFVIGSDYKNKKIVGSEFVKKLIYFEKIKNKSTTEILNYGKTENL